MGREKIYISKAHKDKMDKTRSPPRKENLEEILKAGFKHWTTKVGYLSTIASSFPATRLYYTKDYGDAVLSSVIPITLLVVTIIHQYAMGGKFLGGKKY